MDDLMQVYLNVDENGFIKQVYSGYNIVALDAYHYFFLVEPAVEQAIATYKVVVNDMKPELVKRD